MKADLSELRNSTTWAISSGWATPRPRTDRWLKKSVTSEIPSGLRSPVVMSVTVKPGSTALTVMPWSPSSKASLLVKLRTAALVAA